MRRSRRRYATGLPGAVLAAAWLTAAVPARGEATSPTWHAQARVDSMNAPWRTGKAELDLGQGWIGVLAPERTRSLDRLGINYYGWWMNGLQGNAAGGIRKAFLYAGLFDFGIDLDFGKMGAADDLYLHASGSWALGKNLTEDVGATIPVNAVYSGVSLRFFELWLEKMFLDRELALRLGRVNIGWEYGLDYANFTQVLSAGFRLNLFGLDVNTPNFSVIPFGNWGARLRWTPNDKWRVQGSFMNGYPHSFINDDEHGLDLTFDPAQGAFYIVEGTRQWSASEDARRSRPGLLPGRLFLGAFHDTGTFPALDGSGAEKAGMSTVYAIVKQKVWEPEALSERGINLWTGASYAWPEETTVFPHFWSGGLVWFGPTRSRPHDSLALGFANGWYSSSLPGTSTETVLEAAYSYVWTTWVSIMPDIQYVIRPGGTGAIDNALLLGALVYVTF